MNTFSSKTKILMGENTLETALEGRRRAFIVTDRFMADSGKVDYLTGPLSRLGGSYEIFSDVTPDPDINTVTAGVAHIMAFQPDVVIALGGGSPIDAAKAMVYFAVNQGLKDCPFIAIPTTSGTGSEVSKFAVISDREKQVKYPLVDDVLLPDVAMLDASLVVSVPKGVTADTGVDVFTHAVEAFVSTGRNDFSDAMAEKAIKLVYRYLLKVYKEPDNIEYRQRMHNASCLAGIAFSNAGLGLNHGMAHALGAKLHLPHGRANGILLPYVMSFNAGCTSKLTPTARRYAKIARSIGMGATSTRQSALNLIRFARSSMEKLGIPSSVKATKLVTAAEFEEMLDELAETALADRCTATNPEPCTIEDIKGVFRKAYNGNI
ncbi:MAG: iron-containing alcohol dehydrogenase [Oscillospiraceae bacterium]|nr:iron-containing alcohol dehydrogenase [Oscillospiraceae bacterium]